MHIGHFIASASSHRFCGFAAVLSAMACSSEAEPSEALPCDVAAVLSSACHTCHAAPPQHGAPMPIVTFEDTRAPFTFLPTYDETPVWQVIGDTVESGWMPQPWPGVSLSSDGRRVLLDWTASGAPAAPPGTTCP
jgi:hypothetical protein